MVKELTHSADGEKYVGEWKEGKFIKENLSADGNCVKGNCVNGQGTDNIRRWKRICW